MTLEYKYMVVSDNPPKNKDSYVRISKLYFFIILPINIIRLFMKKPNVNKTHFIILPFKSTKKCMFRFLCVTSNILVIKV